MTPHGPDAQAYEKGIKENEKPIKYPDTVSFMFESYLMLKVANYAYNQRIKLDQNYNDCWKNLKKNFSN